MKKEPRIVQELRKEESEGKLHSKNKIKDVTIDVDKPPYKKSQQESEIKREFNDVKSQKELFSLFDCIDEIIYVVDPKSYKILYANKFLKDLFSEDIVGKTCYSILHGLEFPCKLCSKEIDIDHKKKLRRWEYHNPKTNRDYVVNDRFIHWLDGRDVKFVFAVDVTKLRMALNELEDAHQLLFTVNKQLERKVKDRTLQIEKLIEQKDEFINQLSHDLRTPLTPIMVLLPILEKQTDGKKSKELIEIIARNANFMKELVDKTIELARLNSTNIALEFENQHLLTEVNSILENFELLFEKNHIDVENKINKNIFILADKLKLEELFNNLLTNSIKYSAENDGIIKIDAEKKKEFVTISISDNGLGMDKEQLDHIFEEFYKADESRHDLDSSGLGLSICKRIVEKHGGKIWAQSKGKGKGSTFYFTLKSGNI
ncbi:MAG: PAS domain-containing sensor histidine kinase [Candidatus Thermoplasmatota archaeon]|nr:PAS domain-containing sensor histidine kinase [Candidatus Thermoplasmatota archaeon]